MTTNQRRRVDIVFYSTLIAFSLLAPVKGSHGYEAFAEGGILTSGSDAPLTTSPSTVVPIPPVTSLTDSTDAKASLANTKPTTKVSSFIDTKSTAESTSLTDTKPAGEPMSLTDAKQAAEATSITDSKSAAETTSLTDTKPAGEQMSLTGSKPITEATSLTDTKSISETPSTANTSGAASSSSSEKKDETVSTLSGAVEADEKDQKAKVGKAKKKTELSLSYPQDYPFPLVGIQFPIDYENGFSRNLIGMKHFKKRSSDALESAVNEQVVKSSFLACELYEYLKKKLPPKSIVLIPTKLQYADGKMLSVALSKPLPPVVLVDLFAEVSPARIENPSKHLGSPDTFGDNSRVHVSITTTTGGQRNLIAGQSVTGGGGASGYTIENFYNIICTGGKLKRLKTEQGTESTQKFIELSSDHKYASRALKYEAEGGKRAVDPATTKQFDSYWKCIDTALNSRDLAQTRSLLIAEYFEDLTPDVTNCLLGKTKKESVMQFEKKLRFLDHAALAQRAQSDGDSCTLSEKIVDGEFAKSLRVARYSEMNYARKVSANKRRRNLSAVLSVAGTAGSIATALACPDVPISGLLSAVGASAATVAVDLNKLQKELHETFVPAYTQGKNAQISFLMKLDDDTVEVHGENVEQFRKKVKDMYETKFGDSKVGVM
ncbi:MAG: hypothetical protein K2X93_02805 [Candidatus Obscuribacterales bacterium]|nr:hypothetical protein [Candidatus Obscuribacterales bacterium]